MLALLLLLLVTGKVSTVFAATETGNIEICLEDTGEKIKKDGIVFQYSKVAKWVDESYEMEEKYKEKGVDLNEIHYARELEEAARELSKHRFSDGICRTDQEGKAVITNLKEGIYLVYTTDETDSQIQPVLVQLPKWEEEKGEMQWNVQVCPKQTKTEQSETAAKTGDTQQTTGWIAVCLGAGILVLVVAAKRR